MKLADTNGISIVPFETAGLEIPPGENLCVYVEFIPTPGSYSAGDTLNYTNLSGSFNAWSALTYAPVTQSSISYFLEYHDSTSCFSSFMNLTMNRYSLYQGSSSFLNGVLGANPSLGFGITLHTANYVTPPFTCSASDSLVTNVISCDSTLLSWTSDTSTLISTIWLTLNGQPMTNGIEFASTTSPLLLPTIANQSYDIYFLDSCKVNGQKFINIASFSSGSEPMPKTNYSTSIISKTIDSVVVNFNAMQTNGDSLYWVVNGDTTATLNTDYTFYNNGNYPISISGENRCAAIDSMFVYNISDISIDENSLEENVEIFPNPVLNRLNIQVTGLLINGYRIEIKDLIGKLLMSKTIKGKASTEIDVSHFKTGVYLIEVSQNSKKLNQKFIKL